jgi:uncharacterized protein YecT (DUF1311 family)
VLVLTGSSIVPPPPKDQKFYLDTITLTASLDGNTLSGTWRDTSGASGTVRVDRGMRPKVGASAIGQPPQTLAAQKPAPVLPPSLDTQLVVSNRKPTTFNPQPETELRQPILELPELANISAVTKAEERGQWFEDHSHMTSLDGRYKAYARSAGDPDKPYSLTFLQNIGNIGGKSKPVVVAMPLMRNSNYPQARPVAITNTRLYFHLQSEAQIYKMELQSGEFVKIDDGVFDVYTSPDKSKIAYISNWVHPVSRLQVNVMALADGSKIYTQFATKLSDDPVETPDIQWSSDSSKVYYCDPGSVRSKGLWAMPILGNLEPNKVCDECSSQSLQSMGEITVAGEDLCTAVKASPESTSNSPSPNARNTEPAPAAEPESLTQSELTVLAAENYKKADARLNEEYTTVMESLSDGEKEALKLTQRAWIKFRDQAADAKEGLFKGGSLGSSVRNRAMTEMTEDRIQRLQGLLVRNDASIVLAATSRDAISVLKHRLQNILDDINKKPTDSEVRKLNGPAQESWQEYMRLCVESETLIRGKREPAEFITAACEAELLTSRIELLKGLFMESYEEDKALLQDLTASKVAAQPTAQPQMQMGKGNSSIATHSFRSGLYEGTWQDGKGKMRTFTLYLNEYRTGRFRGVGTVESWTSWEVFEGGVHEDQIGLAGVDVVENKKPKGKYVLDVLTLQGDGAASLTGTWKDKESSSGAISLTKKRDLTPTDKFMDVLNEGFQPRPSAGSATASDFASYKIAINGIGPVRLGMTAAEVELGWGDKMLGDQNHDGAPNCYDVSPEGYKDALIFTIVDGQLAHITVRSEVFATKSGAKIGDPASKLKDLYGDRLTIEESPDHEGTDYTYVPKDAADAEFRLCFIVQGNIVKSILIGTAKTLLMKEFCS